MPYKLWAPFERLLSDDMNTYLSQQIAAIFANAASRDAAIPAPITGQPAYLTDSRTMTVWDGSAWRELARRPLAAGLAATATQSVASGTAAIVAVLPAVTFDYGGFALGSNQLTVPAGADGLYEMEGFVYWASGTSGYRYIRLMVNGAQRANDLRPSPGLSSQTARRVLPLVAGDVIRLELEHTQGAALATIYDANIPTRLTLVRIGPTA